MTKAKEMLAKIMGGTAASMSDWVEPLQDAMYEFGINTPNKIANFLAHVKVEGNSLRGSIAESMRYSQNATLANHASAFLHDATRLGEDGYNVGTTNADAKANIARWYSDNFGINLANNGVNFRSVALTEAQGQLLADRVYSSDKGKSVAQGLGNRTEATQDGSYYRGRGLLQLTGRTNTEQAISYVYGVAATNAPGGVGQVRPGQPPLADV